MPASKRSSSPRSGAIPTRRDQEPVRQRRKEARPGELVAAALQLFVEKGFAATRLDDVARAAGVSKGTLYLYFDSKEALFKAAIQECLVPVLDDIDGMLSRHIGSPQEAMETQLLHWWRTVGATPLGGIPKLLISEARNFPEVAAYYQQVVIQRGHDLLRRALTQGIADGTYRAVDVDDVIDLIFAPMLMLVVWRHSFAGNDHCVHVPFNNPEKYLRAHVDLVMRGLLSADAPSRLQEKS